MISLFKDWLNLFFPRTCAVCGATLLKSEVVMCIECTINLPKTNYHFITENPVNQLFTGRIPIERGTAYFRFQKGTHYKKLIHKLKYKGCKEIGVELGRRFGRDLMKSDFAKTIDCIIPVPLHKRKERLRGYNQSYQIAIGLSEVMGIKIDNQSLKRKIYTQTQTKKTRLERFENVENIFEVIDLASIQNKHILLIDDVLTTGATIEACANALLSAQNVKISIATLATATH